MPFLRNEAWIHNPRDSGQRASPNTYGVLSGKDTSRRPRSNSQSFCCDSASGRSAVGHTSELACWRSMRRFRQYQTPWCCRMSTPSDQRAKYWAPLVHGGWAAGGLGGRGGGVWQQNRWAWWRRANRVSTDSMLAPSRCLLVVVTTTSS